MQVLLCMLSGESQLNELIRHQFDDILEFCSTCGIVVHASLPHDLCQFQFNPCKTVALCTN